jgi:hypothetical protein
MVHFDKYIKLEHANEGYMNEEEALESIVPRLNYGLIVVLIRSRNYCLGITFIQVRDNLHEVKLKLYPVKGISLGVCCLYIRTNSIKALQKIKIKLRCESRLYIYK